MCMLPQSVFCHTQTVSHAGEVILTSTHHFVCLQDSMLVVVSDSSLLLLVIAATMRVWLRRCLTLSAGKSAVMIL